MQKVFCPCTGLTVFTRYPGRTPLTPLAALAITSSLHIVSIRTVGRMITRIPHPLPALVLAHGLARPCPPGRTFPGGVVASQRLQPRHV